MAEASALLLALENIENRKEKYFLIFTDSKSCLQALKNTTIIQILAKANCLRKRNFSIFFCWVPGHMGFSGNEKADITSQEALKLNISECQIPFCDVKPVINWKWNGNMLYETNSSVRIVFFY